MDYEYDQQFPTARKGKTGAIEIVQDMTLPHNQAPMMNIDYNANIPMSEIQVQPLEYGAEIVSGNSNTLRFTINGDSTALIDPRETYLDFSVQIDQGSDDSKLTVAKCDQYSCLANLNTDPQSIRPQAQRLVKASATTCKYVYIPNSAAFFQKIVLRDARNGQELVSTEQPAEILKILEQASMADGVNDPDHSRALEDHLCHISKFMPDDILANGIPSDSTSSATTGLTQLALNCYTPSGNIAGLNGWSSSVNNDAQIASVVVGTNCVKNVCNSIPYFESNLLTSMPTIDQNKIFTSYTNTNSVFTFAGTTSSVSISDVAMVGIAGKILDKVPQSALDTIAFPQVRRQLYDIARGRKFRLNLGLVLDLFNSSCKIPIGFCPLQIDFIMNTYSSAFTDVSATANAVNTDWTRSSTFNRFKLISPRLHISKYTMKASTANDLVKAIAEGGVIIPFTNYFRTVENMPSTASAVYLSFRDRRVRSLDKVIIIPRYQTSTLDNAWNNKLIFNSGARCDTDGLSTDGATRPYDGIYSYQFQYNSISIPQSDKIYVAPYKMTDVKYQAKRLFNEEMPDLQQDNFEGLTNLSAIEKSFVLSCSAVDTVQPVAVSASSLPRCMLTTQYPADTKSFHQGAQHGFFLGYDFRSFKHGMYSGLDISKADLNTTISRLTTSALYTPDIQLDIYYCCGAAIRIDPTSTQFVM